MLINGLRAFANFNDMSRLSNSLQGGCCVVVVVVFSLVYLFYFIFFIFLFLV